MRAKGQGVSDEQLQRLWYSAMPAQAEVRVGRVPE